MHVLVLPSWYPSPDIPNNGVFFREQAAAVAGTGAKVGVVYPESRKLRTLGPRALLENHFQTTVGVEEGIPVVRWHGWNPGSPRLRAHLYRKQAVKLARRYAREHGTPDVIHAQGILWGAVVARELSREWGVPYVVTAHSTAFARGLIERWQEPHIVRALEGAATVMAVGGALAKGIAKYVPGRSVLRMPNMVNTAFFDLPPRPRAADPWVATSVGFIAPKKGFDVLIRAFAAAFPEEDHVLLRIGGDGPDRASLEKLAASVGLKERIEFMGGLSPRQVREALWAANTFVSSSYVETFGVVLIEAMSTGLPVVATRSGGPEDFVGPDVGKLVDPGDVEGLAAAMRALHEEDPAGPSPEVQRRVRDYVVREFDRVSVARRLMSVYGAAVE